MNLWPRWSHRKGRLVVAVLALMIGMAAQLGSTDSDRRPLAGGKIGAAPLGPAGAAALADGGESVAFNLAAATHRKTLANGLRAVVVEQRAAPLVTTLLLYGVGSVHEAEGRTGAAHFLEHMLFKGSAGFPKGEIDRFALRSGGRLNAFTTEDTTGFWFTVPRDLWQEGARIEADRMRGALIEEKEFLAEKQVVLEELKRLLDSPWGKVSQEIDRLIYPRHPYGHPILGWEEDIQRLSRDGLLSFYRDHYAPNHAVLVIAGDVRAEEAFRAAEEIFSPLQDEGLPLAEPGEEPRTLKARRISFASAKEMTRLAAAARTVRLGEAEDYALAVIASLLGRGRSSRLAKRLVEKEKMAHEGGVEVSSDTRRYDGVFYIFLELAEGANVGQAEDVLFDELERLAREPVAERELVRARNVLLADYLFGCEHSYQLAVTVGRAEILGMPDYAERFVERIQKVGTRDIQAAAGKFLARRQFAVAVAEGAEGPAHARRRGRRDYPRYQSGESEPPLAGADPAAVSESGMGGGGMAVPDFGPVFQAVLPNGLAVWIKPRKALPVVAVRLHVNGGFPHDPRGKSGLAHFAGEMLDEGTENPNTGVKRSFEEIAEAIEFVGGELRTDASGVQVRVLAKDLDLALELAADTALYPSFPPERTERVRSAILDEIRAREDDPARVAVLELRKKVFAGHPLGRAGEGESQEVARISRGDLADYHRRFFRPANALLAIAGDVDPEAVLKKVYGVFSSAWKGEGPGGVPPLPPVPGNVSPAAQRVPKDTRQAHCAFGHAGILRTDPDFEALRAMEFILMKSPGFTDRLSKAVRDEGGRAYAVWGDITGSADLWPGLLLVYFGTAAGSEGEVFETARQALVRFRAEGPTVGELEDAKSFLIRSLALRWETAEDAARYLAGLFRYGLPLDYASRMGAAVKGFEPADIRRAAERHLRPEEMSQVVVGPAASGAEDKAG